MDNLSMGKKRNKEETMRGFLVYIILVALFTLPIFIGPVILNNDLEAFEGLHKFYEPTCHQLTSRSQCYFPETGTYEDCYNSSEYQDSKEIVVDGGYKLPVCARDTGFYGFMLIGGILMFALNKHKDNEIPPFIWIIVALIPIGLDGGTQFLGLRESTNLLRFITGGIAGIVFPFYVVPMLNRMLDKKTKA